MPVFSFCPKALDFRAFWYPAIKKQPLRSHFRSSCFLLCKLLFLPLPDKSFSQRGIVQFEGYRSHRGRIVQFKLILTILCQRRVPSNEIPASALIPFFGNQHLFVTKGIWGLVIQNMLLVELIYCMCDKIRSTFTIHVIYRSFLVKTCQNKLSFILCCLLFFRQL